eukprot:125640_1
MQVGDVIEFNYSTTYKARLTTTLSKASTAPIPKTSTSPTRYDMPKWIPIQITKKAFEFTIEYAQNGKETRPLLQKICVGVSGATIGNTTNHCARIRAIPQKNTKNRHSIDYAYLKEGMRIEVFDGHTMQWIEGKIAAIATYIEFKYSTHKNEIIHDSCFMDEVNIRLPLSCIPRKPLTPHDIGRIVRVYWSHSGGEWYEGCIQSIDVTNKMLILFYRDRYMETLRWNVQTTLFYFPITDFDDISCWVYLRPNCGFCGCLMQERMVTKCKYQHNVCWKCEKLFVEKDSIWICPFEKKVKYHPTKYFLDSNCVTIDPDINANVDAESVEQHNNTNHVVGHRNSVINMAQLYRIPIGAPLPHLQLNSKSDHTTAHSNDKETMEKNKYLEQFIHKLYHSVLYQPFNETEYFALSKRYLHTNVVPLRRNRKTALNDCDVVSAAKYALPTQLQQMIEIFIQNKNQHSLFYIFKAIELRYFYIANAWNGRPYSRGLKHDLAMQYQWSINMKHNLIPPVLVSSAHNDHVIAEIIENNNMNTKQSKFIQYTSDPILSGSIQAIPSNSTHYRHNDEPEAEVETVYTESGRMSAFCVPQFDICIFVRNSSGNNNNNKIKGKTKNRSKSFELYKTAQAIILTREDSNVSHREHQWRQERESIRVDVHPTNPWIRGDECMIFVDQSARWLEAKVVKIYETECKVDVYSNELRWPKHRSYGGLSQYIMPKINCLHENEEELELIDQLHHGTPIKIWGPPWREGRVLWKWNEDDLVCIQLNGQRLQYAQTFHVNDLKWKISILKDKPHDIVDISPPLQFIMAKSKYLALPNHVINSGLLIIDSQADSDSDLDSIVDSNPVSEHENEAVIEILDITQEEPCKRQKLNKVKIIKMKKREIYTKKRKKKRKTKNKITSISTSDACIAVYGIEEATIYKENDVIDIRWKVQVELDYCESEFNVYLEYKAYECGVDGKVEAIEMIPYLLASHLSLKPDGHGEYCWSRYVESLDNIHDDMICYIRVTHCSCNISGVSNVFEFQIENKHSTELTETGTAIEFEDDTKLNDSQEIHKNDNGAFCICGAVQDNIEDDRDDRTDDDAENKTIDWIQCDFCYCWQHIKCIKQNDDNYERKYTCPWCASNDEDLALYFEDSKTKKIERFIECLFSASKYRGKRYGFWYGKKQKLSLDSNSNRENIAYLRNLCIARGVDANSNDVDILHSNLMYCSRFARTPLTLSNFMCSLFGINDDKKKKSLRCVDLMAGNGNITRFIAKRHQILAVEKKETRLESGSHLVSNAKWVLLDVFSNEFITQYVLNKTYDVVYCNPDLNDVIPSIYIGLEMIKNSTFNGKCLIFLLPVDAFESNSYHCRLLRILNCHVDSMYQTGRWNYYDKEKSHPKSICDGVWIIKPGRKSVKYAFRSYDVRASLKLSSKTLQ